MIEFLRAMGMLAGIYVAGVLVAYMVDKATVIEFLIAMGMVAGICVAGALVAYMVDKAIIYLTGDRS